MGFRIGALSLPLSTHIFRLNHNIQLSTLEVHPYRSTRGPVFSSD